MYDDRTICVLVVGSESVTLYSGMRTASQWVSYIIHILVYASQFTYAILKSQLTTSCISISPVLMGQIMTRLKLTWLGNEGSVSQTASTFRILLWITIAFIVTRILQYFPLFFFTDEYGSLTNMGYVVYNTCTFLILSFFIFFIALTCKTRKHIRNKYNIPEQSCHGCEDCCCAYWCSCCTVAQMARHTGDYESYAGRCCSETGMPPHAPSIV